MEFAEDRFTAREAYMYENGMMLAYDRDNHSDEYGGLGDFRFGNAWVEGWGHPELIAQAEFEEVWVKALSGRPAVPRRHGLPVWIRMFQEGRYPELPGDWPPRR